MFKVPEEYRVTRGIAEQYCSTEADGNNGVFEIPLNHNKLRLWIIAGDGMGWEHVSVSIRRQNGKPLSICPTWEQMCRVKDLFWGEEDCVVQFHPPHSEYVSCHHYTLHLWRETNKNIQTPPSILVGPDSSKK